MSKVLQTDHGGARGDWLVFPHFGGDGRWDALLFLFSFTTAWDVKNQRRRTKQAPLSRSSKPAASDFSCPRASAEGSEGCQDALSDLPSARHLAQRAQAGVVRRALLRARALQGGHRAAHLQADLPEGPVSGQLRAGQQHHADRGERPGGRHAHRAGLQGRWVTATFSLLPFTYSGAPCIDFRCLPPSVYSGSMSCMTRRSHSKTTFTANPLDLIWSIIQGQKLHWMVKRSQCHKTPSNV